VRGVYCVPVWRRAVPGGDVEAAGRNHAGSPLSSRRTRPAKGATCSHSGQRRGSSTVSAPIAFSIALALRPVSSASHSTKSGCSRRRLSSESASLELFLAVEPEHDFRARRAV
jgi:hypothetical protein